MESRGRKSSAELAIVASNPLQRIEPPEFLNQAQAALWRAVVETKPADWFGDDSAPLLVEYVRAVDTCNLLADQVSVVIASGEVASIKDILTLRDKEAKRAAQLATSLRLTQQSRYTPQAAATANKRTLHAAKPWQVGNKQPVD